MSRYVMDIEELDRTQAALAGGKGAHLGELTRIDGIRVPAGFCVTTYAFERALEAASIGDRLESLARLEPDDGKAIAALSTEIRRTVEAIAIPRDLAAEITGALRRLGEETDCAVRSSASAEDSPTASFAGQHDTYLNVTGPEAILEHVRRCWGSLFSERAVTYRLRGGLDQRQVQMAVVVQKIVSADAAGTLFTADPVSGNRKVSSVEATAGLGEALVSGLVNADVYKVRDGKVAIERSAHATQLLTDTQLERLVQIGRRIEAHFGAPQDIEWCLADDEFQIVQTRPITTLFPIPRADDGDNHVYVSVGHQQMMTDAMKPLGLSVWLATTPRPMSVAGGRLFVDVAPLLASAATRTAILEALGRSDPLIRDALETVLERRDVIPMLPDEGAGDVPPPLPAGVAPTPPIDADPALVDDLIEGARASLATLARDIGTKSGAALVDFIQADIHGELRRIVFDPRGRQVFMTAMEASWWLNEHLDAWLGERNAADALTQSVPNNVTSEMGLALLDVADVIRPCPDVVAFLQRVHDETFLDGLPTLPGGQAAHDAIQAWLDEYGMRCVGEIDITRPRWSERPSALVPILLGNIRNFEQGAGKLRFEQGLQDAREKERELLERLRALPDGEVKAREAKQMIDRLRTFIGHREYPKYHMISRYFLYKRALLEEAVRLVQAGVLGREEDIFFLSLEELREVVSSKPADEELIRERKAAFDTYRRLRPPRVLTSHGEAIGGTYRRDGLPEGALVGLPVSAGTVEGRARVVLEMADAHLERGDILVTACTDPSWTPLFVTIGGLVTEVGGLMTHGAVIAREYGLPAVVGLDDATRRIRDGQQIRVHGTAGYVEILS